MDALYPGLHTRRVQSRVLYHLPSDSVSAEGTSRMRPAATDCRITSLAAGWQPTTLISVLTDFTSAAMPSAQQA